MGTVLLLNFTISVQIFSFIQHKVAPFDNDKARTVLIVSYRASEGTLIGELIDNTPNAMHVTEPLDGVYTAMFGSRDYICPEDIFNNKDGTLRYEVRECYLSTWSL